MPIKVRQVSIILSEEELDAKVLSGLSCDEVIDMGCWYDSGVVEMTDDEYDSLLLHVGGPEIEGSTPDLDDEGDLQ